MKLDWFKNRPVFWVAAGEAFIAFLDPAVSLSGWMRGMALDVPAGLWKYLLAPPSPLNGPYSGLAFLGVFIYLGG